MFNSYFFILLFLPVCIFVYFFLNHFRWYTLGKVFLLGMSLLFYGYFDIKYLILLCISVIINYALSRRMMACSSQKPRKAILATSLFINLGILFYFKYMDFFLSNINHVFHTEYSLWRIALPLGISFFTFQQIAYSIDVYKEEYKGCSFLDYALCITFFPKTTQGPIIVAGELLPQFSDTGRKKIDWDNMTQGVYIFTLGLAKKVLLADVFGSAANVGYGNIDALDATNALITMLAYTMQIYFDFSGYSDMALGLGKMLNIELPVNFDSPYKALTITDFWKRWHISLTRFFTKYVYIPLGGNRKGNRRTYINMLVVFLLSGLWHGASWNFVFWGACHGIFSVITRRFRMFFVKLHPALNWMLTFGFVNVTWVFFRAETLPSALRLLNRIVRFNFGTVWQDILACFRTPEIVFFLKRTPVETVYPYITMTVFFIGAFLIILGSRNAVEKMRSFKPTKINAIITAGLLVWCIFSLSGISTFVYSNF